MATGFDLSHVCFAGRPAAATGQIARPAGCKSPAPSPTPLRADEPAHGFVGWVLDRSGLDASVYRHRPLLRRLPSCLRTLQVRSVAEGRALLENRPDLLPAAVGSLLIGVTEFFRDPAVFEAVRARVVPELAACRRGPLRIWSAGCSSGEELYSLAILLAEAGVLAGSFLLGTDCRIEAVRQASAGVYNAAPSEPAVRQTYFEPAGESWRVSEALRRQARWEVADLAEETARGPWDVILWRNLAIYLNPGPAEALWRRLTAALAPAGFLIVGKAERVPAGLDLVPVCRSVYRKGSRGTVPIFAAERTCSSETGALAAKMGLSPSAKGTIAPRLPREDS